MNDNHTNFSDPKKNSFLYDRIILFFRLIRYSGWKTVFRKTKNFLLYFLPTVRYREVRNSPYYDRQWYLKTYLRAEIPWVDPLRHFMEAGWQYGHCPSIHFPLTVYFFYHPELRQQNKCPLVEFMEKHRNAAYLTELCRRFDMQLADVHRTLKWTRGIPPLKAAETGKKRRIGVHLHCFYPDMLPGIFNHLKKIPVPFDLFISIPENNSTTPESLSKYTSTLVQMRECVIRRVPNRGRDLAPLICTFGRQLAEYDFICHIHTKRSPHLKDGASWQDFLLNHLFREEEWIRRLLSMLENGTSVIYPRDFLSFPEPSGWGENLIPAQAFLDRIGKKIHLKTQFPVIEFPQGSMFWARGRELSDFLSLKLEYQDFPEEPIGPDGSMAHVLEHLFLVLVYEKCSSVFQAYLPEEESGLQEKRYTYRELTSFSSCSCTETE